VTIVVTMKVTDGIVLAADSAATFYGVGQSPFKIYNNANKIFNLVRGCPVGALVYGAGSIGSASVETLSKDLRTLFRESGVGDTYHVDTSQYTIESIANLARLFLFDTSYKVAYPTGLQGFYMGYRVCGYSANASLSEIWEFSIVNDQCAIPYQIQGQGEFGARWAGENEALDRLLIGASGLLRDILLRRGMVQADIDDVFRELVGTAGTALSVPAMPIQDAIDVARFLVDTATKFARYGLRPETIGGPTEIAAITKHEGFKWVERKHYYRSTLNQETDHV
jgi:hypothetical protein